MRAHLEPLKGKYYGTEIAITHEDGEIECFNVWIHGNNHDASERELANMDYPGDFEYNDSHYETQGCLEICRKIVKAINGQ